MIDLLLIFLVKYSKFSRKLILLKKMFPIFYLLN